MRLIISGGGTGGHVYPALAVVPELNRLVKQRRDELAVRWIGTVDGMEQGEVFAAKWPLEVFQYGSNLLAAVSGGTGFTPGPTGVQSSLGGAMSGAAIGARISGGSMFGAGAGALLGGIGGYLLGR